MRVGVIGHGFIGQALTVWLAKYNPDVQVVINDPPKGLVCELQGCDAYFIQIHIPTEQDGTQNLNELEAIISGLPQGFPIWVRTTILPGSLKTLSEKTGRRVWFMPEFLSQRTYVEDFERQTSVFTGDIELLKRIFPGKRYVAMTSEEAEMAKYAHNVFGALKVTYFNCIRDLCERSGLDYRKVLDGVLASGYVNKEHTASPGPDGKFGYGGKCFPKDVRAMAAKYKGTSLGELISPLERLNEHFRGKEI